LKGRHRLARRTVYPDLRWPELKLIVEIDSVAWHDDPLAQHEDALRQAELEALAERVLRLTPSDLRERPQQTLARLRATGVPEA
jgi:very-short-patch-repair endonuclease